MARWCAGFGVVGMLSLVSAIWVWRTMPEPTPAPDTTEPDRLKGRFSQ